jgi:hypothetical protein
MTPNKYLAGITRKKNLKINNVKLYENKGFVTFWPCHFTKKDLKAKEEELWKLKYLTMQKI